MKANQINAIAFDLVGVLAKEIQVNYILYLFC